MTAYMSGRRLTVAAETWPIAGTFRISRGARTETQVVVIEIAEGDAVGRAECVPYPRYGESIADTVEQLTALEGAVADGLDRQALQTTLPAGAMRNALDCALWDLDAKRGGTTVWQLAGLAEPKPLVTAYTLSLDTIDAMGASAAANSHRPLLKVKLDGDEVVERIRAIHENAPASSIIVDANEAWTPKLLAEVAPQLGELGVEMIEQPLHADDDSALDGMARPVPLCADESCHDSATVPGLVGRYDLVNIKLEKTGGLTEAFKLADIAEAAGFGIMVGCMIGTSLSMAPATLVASRARFADLDGPLLLAQDRDPGITFEGSVMSPPPAALWG